MTKAQMRAYKKHLEEQRRIAQEKLDAARAAGDLDNSKELEEIENMLDEL